MERVVKTGAYDPEEICFSALVVVLSFAGFYFISEIVKLFTPENVPSKHEWKWKNTCISFVHSNLIGVWSVLCFYYNPKLAEDCISTYTTFSQLLVAVSLGYFIFDTMDLLKYNRGRQTYELILHHSVLILCLSIALIKQLYIGYAVVSLTIEINSIFLHLRQIMQMLGYPKDGFTYRLNSLINLGTFIVCRIVTIAWMTRWVLRNRDNVPLAMYIIGSVGLAIMTVMNIILLYRLLYSDFVKRSTTSTSLTKKE